jgi:hypothetical protein
MTRMMFRALWGIDAVIALVIVYFFVVGLADGSVSSFNGGLWAGILATLGAVLFGSYSLRAAGRSRAAISVLMALAIPGVLCGLLLLAAIILQPRWN